MTFEQLIESIRHSPLLPTIVLELQQQIAREQKLRSAFYQDMTPEQKVEFIDGEVVLHSPAKNQHLIATGCIFRVMGLFVDLRKLGTVKSEKCLCVFPRNDYEPDVVFFGIEKSARLQSNTLQFPVPDLVVEVLSDSTESRDRGAKFIDYAAQGVLEYWIVDAEQRMLEQYLLRSSTYQLKKKSDSGVVECQAIQGFSIEITALFDSQKNLEAVRTILEKTQPS
jgi:Uma2 family endonuclease